MLSGEKVRQVLSDGVSVIVGSASPQGRPSCCRAVGLVVDPDAQGITVYVPVITSSEVIADVATTGQVAIVCSNPIDHATVQLKGRRRLVRVAAPEELPVIRDLAEHFAETVEVLGLPKRFGSSLTHWPAFAVEVDVDAVFEQTPGPRAGSLVKSK
jgi:Pyridoxamine 5'-phosphate oxidase